MADHVDFAEHYFHAGAAPFTDGQYPMAVNANLTALANIPFEEGVASHAYPYQWYTGTAADPTNPAHWGLGAQLSQIFTGMFPAWNTPNAPFSPNDLFVFRETDAAILTASANPINFGQQTNILTGNVQVDLSSATLTTASPAILTTLLEIDEPFSAFRFDMEFLSENPGMLSVYLGEEQIFSFENALYGAGPGDLLHSGLVWLSEEHPAGPYSLAFRLDPLGETQTSIEISNLEFITLVEAPPELLGDYNGNGTVDAADYTVWRNAFGQAGAALGADGNDDGVIDDLDYDIWKANFGETIDSDPGLLGDYNANGTVDAADYTVWRNTFGDTGAGLAADGNGNGQIDSEDYDFWKSHFGESIGSGSGAHVAESLRDSGSAVSERLPHIAVPEPNCLAWLLLAILGGFCRPGRLSC
jgi:hypothetical protein